jgi:hypothetical protein
MKRFSAALLLATFAGAVIACPDQAKEARAGTSALSSKPAEVQPQMSRAPAATPPKTFVATPKGAKAGTPTTATADTTKKASSGG